MGPAKFALCNGHVRRGHCRITTASYFNEKLFRVPIIRVCLRNLKCCVQKLKPVGTELSFLFESWNTTAPGRVKATIEGNCKTDTLCRSSRPLCYRTLRDYHTPSHSLPADRHTNSVTTVNCRLMQRIVDTSAKKLTAQLILLEFVVRMTISHRETPLSRGLKSSGLSHIHVLKSCPIMIL